MSKVCTCNTHEHERPDCPAREMVGKLHDCGCPYEPNGAGGVYVVHRAGCRPRTRDSRTVATLTGRMAKCLRGGHEVGAGVGPPFSFFGADAGDANASDIKFCRHCRCLYVEG